VFWAGSIRLVFCIKENPQLQIKLKKEEMSINKIAWCSMVMNGEQEKKIGCFSSEKKNGETHGVGDELIMRREIE